MSEEQPAAPNKLKQFVRGHPKLTVFIMVAVILAIIYLIFRGWIDAGWIDEIRDLIIIGLALEMFAIGGAILFLIYQLIKLIALLRDEVIPLIRSAQETVNSARGTTTYVGRKIVEPTAKAAATAARLQTMVRVLFKGK